MSARTIALTVLATRYAPEITSQINRTCVALRTLPIVVGKGANVAWTAKGDGATAAAMSEGAAAGTPSNDVQQPAVLNWGYYKSDGAVTGPAQAAAMTTESPEGNQNLLSNDIKDSFAALASQINQHIYSGSGSASPKQITGLDSAIGDDTNTYATIVRGTYTWFKPKVINPAVATPITQEMIRQDLGRIKILGGESPNLALCHPDVLRSIEGTFDTQRRYNQDITFDAGRRGIIKLDASVGAIVIGGCTFIEDKDAPLESGNTSGKIYYLNTRYVELQVQPQPEIAPLLRAMGIVPGMVLNANDGFGEIPLLAAVVAMAKTGDSDQFMTKCYAELKVTKPSTCGVRRFVQIN